MPEAVPLEEAAGKARVTASVLRMGSRFEVSGLALLAISLVLPAMCSLPPQARIGILVSILAACLQACFGLRVALDARIFGDWSERWDRIAVHVSTASSLDSELASFDRALASCGLRKNTSMPDGSPRALEDRMLGALRQLKLQALALLIQFVALACAIFIVQFSAF